VDFRGAAQGTQLVALDRMSARQAVLDPPCMQDGPGERTWSTCYDVLVDSEITR
jgi:hypothetical protein